MTDRPRPEDICIVDERATERAQRVVCALNDLDRKGKKGPRYEQLEKELAKLMAGHRPKKPVGVAIGVPRVG